MLCLSARHHQLSGHWKICRVSRVIAAQRGPVSGDVLGSNTVTVHYPAIGARGADPGHNRLCQEAAAGFRQLDAFAGKRCDSDNKMVRVSQKVVEAAQLDSDCVMRASAARCGSERRKVATYC